MALVSLRPLAVPDAVAYVWGALWGLYTSAQLTITSPSVDRYAPLDRMTSNGRAYKRLNVCLHLPIRLLDPITASV